MRLSIQHSLHMDNARPHISRYTRNFLNNHNINHVKSPAQSPDINPIEMVWNDLKKYISEITKPGNEDELINGIFEFWNSKVTPEYCNKKINHIKRVLSAIKKLEGKATGM